MFVVSTGMACSVGLGAAAACAAMRAGIAKFDELPYLDSRVDPMIGAAVPGLDEGIRRHERLTAMLATALAECLAEQHSESLEKVPLLVALAEPERRGGCANMADSIVRGVQKRLGVRFHPGLSRAIPQGHTAGFRALAQARELLKNAGVPACLVCGVDSYINARSLRWLEQDGRLKTKGNSNGVVPGEAAAAVWLEPQAVPQRAVNVRISGLGFAQEKAGVLSEEPLLGLGLAEAARAALAEAGLAVHEIDFRLSDVTGESYGFKEQSLMLARLIRVRREKLPLWHCADAIGDTGAAAGICQVVVAYHAFVKGYAPGGHALGCTSAIPADRAVAVLECCRGANES